MKKSMLIFTIILGLLLLLNFQYANAQDIAKGDEDPNANYAQVFEKTKAKSSNLIINSDELNRIVEQEINIYLKKLKKELSKELRQQIKREVKSAITQAMKSQKKVSIARKVKALVTKKIQKKVKKTYKKKRITKKVKTYKKRTAKKIKKYTPKPKKLTKVKIDMVEVRNGGYIQYIKIGNDSPNGINVKRWKNVPAILIIRCSKGNKGQIRMYAQNIYTGRTYLIHEMKTFEFIKGYGEDQFLWNGTYWRKGRRIGLPIGTYKVFCEVDLYGTNVHNGKVGYIKRYWGKKFSSYNVYIK